MRRQKEGEFDKFINWIEHLKNASNEGKLILVQGKRDKDKLAGFGIKSNAIEFFTKPEERFIEKITDLGKECILLFNVDKSSEKLAERVKTELRQQGVKVNTRFRKFLYVMEVKEVRALLPYLEKHLATSWRDRSELVLPRIFKAGASQKELKKRLKTE